MKLTTDFKPFAFYSVAATCGAHRLLEDGTRRLCVGYSAELQVLDSPGNSSRRIFLFESDCDLEGCLEQLRIYGERCGIPIAHPKAAMELVGLNARRSSYYSEEDHAACVEAMKVVWADHSNWLYLPPDPRGERVEGEQL